MDQSRSSSSDSRRKVFTWIKPIEKKNALKPCAAAADEEIDWKNMTDAEISAKIDAKIARQRLTLQFLEEREALRKAAVLARST